MQRKEVVIIAIITFIVVVAWIATSVIGTRSSAPVNPKINQVIEPIDPTFDQSTIDKIKKLGTIQVPTPGPRINNTASASALPLPANIQATRSAQTLPGDNTP